MSLLAEADAPRHENERFTVRIPLEDRLRLGTILDWIATEEGLTDRRYLAAPTEPTEPDQPDESAP